MLAEFDTDFPMETDDVKKDDEVPVTFVSSF